MSLLAELRRRNVIRMAGLYLVGAWLVVQVAQTLLPIFDTPAWVSKSLVVLLAIGFVPALVFSWLYELTPEGLRRDREVAPEASIAAQTGRRMDRLIFAGLLALIAVIAADRYWPRETGSGSVSAAATTPAAPAAGAETGPDPVSRSPNGIAVLPFVNMSADKDNSFFSDGISEELLNVLVRVEGLDVASRTSSFAYKGRELGTRRIAEELQVSYLLEGSVRKAGNKVRITAQLIDAVNDRHLWSETYDRDLTDIFVIQDEIANAIVTALRAELAGATAPLAPVKVQADTANLPAYESYLKARELFIARSDLPESVRLFERTVELDPGFARGWEGLAAIYSILESWNINDRDYTELARAAAKKALALDPSLSMPWAAMGMAEVNRLPADWAVALEHMDKAIAADPRNATAFLWRSIVLQNLGFFAEGVQDLEKCLALDPAYLNCVRWKALALLYTGDTEQALRLFEDGVKRGFVRNRGMDFIPALHASGDRVGARLLLSQFVGDVTLADQMIAALDDPTRPPPDIGAILARGTELKLDGPNQWDLAIWFGAVDTVESIPRLGIDNVIAWQPRHAAWRNSPSYKRVLRSVGLVDYWRSHRYPPQCRPVGTDDFECDAPGRL